MLDTMSTLAVRKAFVILRPFSNEPTGERTPNLPVALAQALLRSALPNPPPSPPKNGLRIRGVLSFGNRAETYLLPPTAASHLHHER